MTSGGKLYTVAQVARPSAAVDGKLMVSIGQWYLRFSALTIAASVTRPRSGSLPVWSALESSTASTAPRIVRGPGKIGGLDDIPALYAGCHPKHPCRPRHSNLLLEQLLAGARHFRVSRVARVQVVARVEFGAQARWAGGITQQLVEIENRVEFAAVA